MIAAIVLGLWLAAPVDALPGTGQWRTSPCSFVVDIVGNEFTFEDTLAVDVPNALRASDEQQLRELTKRLDALVEQDRRISLMPELKAAQPPGLGAVRVALSDLINAQAGAVTTVARTTGPADIAVVTALKTHLRDTMRSTVERISLTCGIVTKHVQNDAIIMAPH